MWKHFQKLPLAISLPSIFILMMMIPSAHGFYAGNEHQGRTFFYAVLLGLFTLVFLGFSMQGSRFSAHRHTQLWSLIAFFLGFPIFLAVPFHEVTNSGGFINSYLDIVSTVTTTGLPVFPTSALSETLVIWRVCLGWASGFLIWVFAWSVFAPLNLGGFEHLEARGSGKRIFETKSMGKAELPAEKFWRSALRLAPVYFWITATASLALLISTGDPVFAILRAMSTISTFGIEIPGHSGAGWSSEAILMVVMVFALSRATFSNPFFKTDKLNFCRDPEIQVAVILITVSVLLLFCIQWPKLSGSMAYIKSVWGFLFTSLSFLSTTGVVSDYFPDVLHVSSQAYFVIGALAMLGGGVATTAGGIKLLRVYILAKHCKAEVDRLIAPSQVFSGQSEKIVTSDYNAMLACVFLMLFILVFATITLGLTLTGSSVDDALLLTVATLTNTGPAAQGVGALSNTVLELGTDAKLILALAMIFGRLEVLALLALLNPDIYR
tara:strand:+ start:6425 stop:7906 length:1482 start_codon:yes stop_codon:yes gene_type:complete